VSTVSKPYTFSPNTTASSSEVNANFNTIYNDYNGNINSSNLATGAVSTAKIADDAVTSDKIADAAVTSSQINFGGSGAGVWWEEIGRTTLASAGDTISVTSLPARKYLKIQVSTGSTGGTTNNFMRFNNDSGSNYAERYVEDGTSSTLVSQTAILLAGATITADAYIEAYILNVTSKEKQVIYQGSRYVTGAANAPSGSKVAWGKWSNTSVQINRIDVVNTGTGDFGAGSQIVVLGHD